MLVEILSWSKELLHLDLFPRIHVRPVSVFFGVNLLGVGAHTECFSLRGNDVLSVRFRHRDVPRTLGSLQQLEMTSDLIDHGLWSRTNTQNSSAAARYLRTTGIVDDLPADTQADGLSLQNLKLLFALDLQRNLCLTVVFPTLQDRGLLSQECLVACEGCM